jgi:hypothetical protein
MWKDWAVRIYLVFAAVQGFGIGLTGLLVPPDMQIPLQLSPLNARFVAALYVAGGIGVLLAAMSPRRTTARLFCVGFGLATLLILGVTLLHWPDFMADPLPHRPVWIFDYVVDPVLALLLVPLAGLWPPRHGTRHSLSAVLWAETIAFGALGLLLLLAPGIAASYWPWALPQVAGQLYGCFLLTFAIGAALAARETEPRAVRDFLIASFALCVLVLVASALHTDRFKPEVVSVIWFAAFGVGAVAFGTGVLLSLRRPAAVEAELAHA